MQTSYEGCNKEIAQGLQRGIHVFCSCWGLKGIKNPKDTRVVAYTYEPAADHGYYMDDKGTFYDCAKVIELETYIISAVALMRNLIEKGYTVRRDGVWEHPENVRNDGMSDYKNVPVELWRCCNKPMLTPEPFETWMIEERRVEDET